MRGRTFFRIMIDNLFVNNAFCKTILAMVNFCNEWSYYKGKKLKFLKKKPLTKLESNCVYEKKFLFNTNEISGAKQK